MFIRFDMIHEYDRQTDGQTDTAKIRSHFSPSAGISYIVIRQVSKIPYQVRLYA